MDIYRSIYERSLEDPGKFWADAAAALHWDRPWDRVLDDTHAPFYRWFKGGRLNTCYNAVDRHVAAGRGSQPAIIHDSPVTGSQRTITYAELQGLVARFAGMMVRHGVSHGDRVIVYMPMVPEALVAMLACARIGAVHSVVFGGFAANELATRINDAKPVLIVSASCGIEGAKVIPYKPLLDRAIEEAAHKPSHTIILQRPQATGRAHPRPRPRLGGIAVRAPGRLRAGRGHRPALHPLHLGHDRPAQGRGARPWRPRHGSALDHAPHLRRPARRGVLGGLRRRLGRRPQLHLLRAPAQRQHDHRLRGQARRHARPGCLLARDRRAQGLGPVHRTHGLPRDQEGGPGGGVHRQVRPLVPAHPVPRRRALRPRHAALGRGPAGRAGDRPLVADGDRLGDRRQPDGHRAAAGPPRLADRAHARLRRADPGRGGRAAPGRQDGGDLHPPAHAAGLPADALARRRALPPVLPRPLPRLVPDRRRRLQGRGRLPLHHEPHRRRHQRRRPPPVDRRHGGGAGLAQGCRRVRGHRRGRPAQGRAARWVSWCSRPVSSATRRRSGRSWLPRSAIRSARSPPSSSWPSSPACPRPARARSCAAR